MKLDLNTLGKETETFGTVGKSIVGGMKASKIAVLVDFISNQVYGNPVGSIVRELTSNCFDAHIALGKLRGEPVNDPVIVKYFNEGNVGYISFIDVGIGLTEELVGEIYINIFETTKGDNDDEIGGFGIGAKSFLSYTDSIDLITRVEGIEYYYIIGKNQEGLIEATPMYAKETTERNGTEVRICLGDTIEYKDDEFDTFTRVAPDYRQFKQEVINQLVYFDNVYTVGFDLDNEYKIYEGETFKVRSGVTPFKEMHIILGKVAYPIDWDILGMEPVKIPVGIKFNIGELKVVPSRENIRYNDKQLNQLIKDRIEDCLAELVKLYNKSSTSIDDLHNYLLAISGSNKVLNIKDVELKFPVVSEWDAEKGTWVYNDVIKGLEPVKYTAASHIPLLQIPRDPYFVFKFKEKIVGIDGRGTAKVQDLPENFSENKFASIHHSHNRQVMSFYRIKGQRNKVQDAYLWWKEKKPIVLIAKERTFFNFYCKTLGLGGEKVKRFTSKKNELFASSKKTINTPFIQVIDGVVWNKYKIIKEYKRVITKDLVQRTSSYDEKPTEHYQNEMQLLKIRNKKVKLEGHITVYDIVEDGGKTSKELDLASLNNFKGFIVYGTKEQASKLRAIEELISNAPVKTNKNSKFVSRVITINGTTSRDRWKTYYVLRPIAGRIYITAKSNFKHLQGNPYFMEAEEFLANGNRVFRNAVTAWFVLSRLQKIQNKFKTLHNNLYHLNIKLHKEIEEMNLWASRIWRQHYANEDFMQACFQTGLANNLLWIDKIEQVKKIEEWFTPDLEIFNFIDNKCFTTPRFKEDMVLLLKMKHKRLSAEHYQYAKPIPLELPQYQLVEEPIEHKLLIYNHKQTA